MILSASCSAVFSATRLGNVKKLRPKVRQDAPRRAQVAVRAYTVTLKFPDEEDKVVEVDGDPLATLRRFTAPNFRSHHWSRAWRVDCTPSVINPAIRLHLVT